MLLGIKLGGWHMLGATVIAACMTFPTKAHAACDVPESGIPGDAALHIDVAGMRKALAASGIGIGGFYAAETFGNPSGGFKQGATYDGVLELHLDGDLKKWGLWKGLCLHANGYQIHGRSISADYVHSLMTVSNLEATSATKLYELWLQQSLFNERLSVRVGQLAADGDFLVSVGGAYFLDGTGVGPHCLLLIFPAADLPILSRHPECAFCLAPTKTSASKPPSTMATRWDRTVRATRKSAIRQG
jgi:hypothetical protein